MAMRSHSQHMPPTCGAGDLSSPPSRRQYWQAPGPTCTRTCLSNHLRSEGRSVSCRSFMTSQTSLASSAKTRDLHACKHLLDTRVSGFSRSSPFLNSFQKRTEIRTGWLYFESSLPLSKPYQENTSNHILKYPNQRLPHAIVHCAIFCLQPLVRFVLHVHLGCRTPEFLQRALNQDTVPPRSWDIVQKLSVSCQKTHGRYPPVVKLSEHNLKKIKATHVLSKYMPSKSTVLPLLPHVCRGTFSEST